MTWDVATSFVSDIRFQNIDPEQFPVVEIIFKNHSMSSAMTQSYVISYEHFTATVSFTTTLLQNNKIFNAVWPSNDISICHF